MTLSSPSSSDWKAALAGSTDRVESVTDTPASRPATSVTVRSALLSTSAAPANRSTSNVASSSSAEAVRAAATVGVSLVPVMVIVALWATEAPCSSVTL